MAVLLSAGQKKLNAAFHQVLDTFESGLDFSRGVFIKPNVVFPARPTGGEITPPQYVRLLILTLRERRAGMDILLGEGVAAGCDAQENFRVSGYTAMAQEMGVPLLDLNNVERRKVAWKFGKLDLPAAALERVYINLPILKPSSACVISGALKNQKGLLLPGVKKQFHRLGLHEQIAELNAAARPALTILDCRRFFGRNFLISGDNCGEIDATACRLLGIEEPEHVRLARAAGVFASGFPVTGDETRFRAGSAPPVEQEYKQLGRLRLWSNPQACTGCRYLFHEIQQYLLRSRDLPAGLKLLTHSLRGAEIVMGKNPRWRKEYRTVICVGACTFQMAKDGGYVHIPGCPPTFRDFFEHLP